MFNALYGSVESLQAQILALQNDLQEATMERDMWQKQAMASSGQQARNEVPPTLPSTGGLQNTPNKTLSRHQTVARLNSTSDGSINSNDMPALPSTTDSPLRPSPRRSTMDPLRPSRSSSSPTATTPIARKGMSLRHKPSVSRMVANGTEGQQHLVPNLEQKTGQPTKASFDIIKCTDEVCELIKVPKGLLTTTHQDTTTAKLMWKDRPATVLLVKKPEDTPSRDLMCRLGKYLVEEMQFQPVVVDPLVIAEINDDKADEWVKQSIQYFRPYTPEEQQHLHRHIDIVITVGGDGTVLWTAQLFEGPCPPVISFSMGSMGFLTPFHANDYKEVLTSVVEKGCFLSVRSRVEGIITTEGSKTAKHSVLNEIVVDRGPASTLGNLMSYCNGQVLTRVQADGIIIGTPTGSTAYSLSAGGSIVHPAVPSMVFTPICPHTLSFRSMIFPDSVTLKIVVPHDSRSTAWASFDGKHRTELKRGDSLSMTVSRCPVPLVCKISEQSDWLESVKEQLFWNMRVVQKKKEDVVTDERGSVGGTTNTGTRERLLSR